MLYGWPLPPDWKFLLLLRRTTSDVKCGAGVIQQTIFPELAGLGFNRSILYGRPPQKCTSCFQASPRKQSMLYGLPLPHDWKFLILLRWTTSDVKRGAGMLQQTIFPELAGLGVQSFHFTRQAPLKMHTLLSIFSPKTINALWFASTA